jgi:phosphoribosylformimino-5-aminoimidazole carboxamide ribotide isomerase
LASPFDVLPAIDLRGGRVVRLAQGDFEQETAFSDDPVAVATGFVSDGARWLHVVDLDGARDGRPVHLPTVRAIIEAVGDRTAVEVAGGLRSPESVASVLSSGASRVVFGTAALRDPAFVERLIDLHGADRVAVAVDVRDGMAVGEGWRAGAPGIPIDDAIGGLADVGVMTLEVTAIERDGLLIGPDLALYRRVVDLHAQEVIASAGVAALADVVALRAIGCRGVIVGRALYDGRLRLRDVIETAAAPSPDLELGADA